MILYLCKETNIMAYIDNKSIVVDAVLTKKGRQLLATNGSLNITSFALADDEIDYSLYNPSAPTADLADVALVNTPVFEPNIDETQTMKYKLVTLDPGTTIIPVISVAQTTIVVDSMYTGRSVISPATAPANYNTKLGYTAILSNGNVGTIVATTLAPGASKVGTVPVFAGDITAANSQTVVGLEFAFIPSQQLAKTTTTTLTIVGNESGGGVVIPVTVTVN